MTKIDKSYLEKLGEVLHDEKKAINYKTVSLMLGVHVNIAKQMLHHLHRVEKEDGKRVYATYYVSGVMPRNVIMSLQKKTDMDASKQSSMGDLDGYLVAICREKDLEDLKAKFNKIFSIHMYSLSAFPIDNNDALENLVEFPLKNNEGRTPVEFGPITSSASQKLLNNVRAIPVSKDVPKAVKDEVKKINNSKETVKECSTSDISKSEDTSKTETTNESKSKQLTKPAPVSTNKKDGGRLKSMFATAATKPKSQKPTKLETIKPDTNSEIKEKDNSGTREKSSSARSKDSRKRKRIRDVLSSESEDEGKKSEDDEDSLSESPVPRKRIQIDSDSDDDCNKETSVKKVDSPPSTDVKNVTSGRKRVAKMISKSYMDKDGFLVTTKEQVMVSEEEDNADANDKQDSKKPSLDKPSIKQAATKSTGSQPVKSSTSKNALNSGKTKQASLMSFFQKK